MTEISEIEVLLGEIVKGRPYPDKLLAEWANGHAILTAFRNLQAENAQWRSTYGAEIDEYNAGHDAYKKGKTLQDDPCGLYDTWQAGFKAAAYDDLQAAAAILSLENRQLYDAGVLLQAEVTRLQLTLAPLEQQFEDWAKQNREAYQRAEKAEAEVVKLRDYLKASTELCNLREYQLRGEIAEVGKLQKEIDELQAELLGAG